MLNPEVEPGQFSDLDRFIFESWGYLIIPNVLSAEEIAACTAASRRIHASAGTVGWGQVGRGYETEPALERLIDHPGVLPKVRGLYGDRFILQSGWNTMQPAHGKMGRWHQDGSSAYDFYKLGYPIPLLQLRASFLLTDQSRPGMGNMELIPGSHHYDPAAKETRHDDKSHGARLRRANTGAYLRIVQSPVYSRSGSSP